MKFISPSSASRYSAKFDLVLLIAAFCAAPQATIALDSPLQNAATIYYVDSVEGSDGAILRSWPCGPPGGTSMGKVLKIEAEQDGKALAVEINYDRQIWSGLSWGAGEIKHKDIPDGHPITIRCSSAEKGPIVLKVRTLCGGVLTTEIVPLLLCGLRGESVATKRKTGQFALMEDCPVRFRSEGYHSNRKPSWPTRGLPPTVITSPKYVLPRLVLGLSK